MLVKLEWLGYRMVKKLWQYVKPFSSDTGTLRTDRRTDLLYQYRASVWLIEFLHPAMWHVHDIDFARWLHPAMKLVALESWQWIHQVAACDTWLWDDMHLNSPGGSTLQCDTALGSWHWISQVAAPCNVAGGSGMKCHGICSNVRHIGILHLVSILTISPQATCCSAPVCEILSKSDHPRQKKMTSSRFSRWRISAILDFRGPIIGSLKSPCK